MKKHEAFLDFITPGHLYFAALIFVSLMFVLIIMIYVSQYSKKLKRIKRDRINEQLNSWIGEAMVEGASMIVRLTPRMNAYFKKPEHRQYIADSLINVKKNITGTAAENIAALYEQLGLKKDSVSKLNSFTPHLKARGIFELYMMDQQEMAPEIAKHTDSRNELVRTEAQTALIGFKGFEGLSFLHTLTTPFSEWQQLKLLELLHKLDPTGMEDIPLWLTSSNDNVVIFALKLTDIYQQLHVHGNVASCLSSENEKIRSQAIKTLGRIANEYTPGILKAKYPFETDNNKRTILKQLRFIGSEHDLEFLQGEMKSEDDSLKLEAARAYARCNAEGWPALWNFAGEDATLVSIAKQVKYEMAA